MRHSQSLRAGGIIVVCLVAMAAEAAEVAGRTPGSFQVTSTGVATYTIPLWTPPGVAGIQPKLALSYSSTTGNGLLGVGWSLVGQSAITRCPRTWVQDGTPGPIELSSNDRFCLDGQRLLMRNGASYGAAGSTYATELETFALVTAEGTAGSGPEKFVVQGKDGLRYEYGYTTDSRIEAGSSVLVWALSRISDRAGNAVKFFYTEENGTYRIERIEYPYTATGGGPYYRVRFTYEDRPADDPPLSGYVAGVAWQQSKRLDYITVESSNAGAWAAARRFDLSYAQDAASRRSHLTSLQECAGSDCFAATAVTYEPGAVGWEAESAPGLTVTSLGSALPIDVNGDGRDDLVYENGGTLALALANGAGFDGAISTGISATYFSAALPVDLDRDGRMDVILPTGPYAEKWRGLYSTGAGFTIDDTLGDTAGGPSTYLLPAVGAMIGTAHIADYDGDGVSDILYAHGGSIYTWRGRADGGFSGNVVTLYTPDNGWTLNCPVGGTFGSAQNRFRSDVRRVNLNGDARDDVLVQECRDLDPGAGTSWEYVWNSLVSNGTSLVKTAQVVSSQGQPLLVPGLLDANGDGNVDFLWATGPSTYWQLAVGKGNGAFAQVATSLYVADVSSARFADVDGDGRTDVISDSGGVYAYARSLGSDFAAPSSLGISVAATQGAKFADLNGDGRVDWLYTASNAVKLRLRSGNAAEGRATALTDGFGIGHRPTYVTLTQGAGSVYTKLSSASFPAQDFQGSTLVVAAVSKDSGNGTAYTQDFQYTGAQVHLQGRGFLGFKTRKMTDSRSSIRYEHTFSQSWPYIGMATDETVRQSNGTIIQDTDNTLTNTLYSQTGAHFPYVSQSVTNHYEVGGVFNGAAILNETTNNTVDLYGNLTKVVVVRTDMDTSSFWHSDTYTTTVTRNIDNDETYWCLGLPHKMTTKEADSSGSLTRTRTANVDYVNCRVTGETVEPGNATLEVATTYGFDGCGNVASTSVVGRMPDGTTAMPARTTTINYGARCQAPTVVTNALSQATQISYRDDFVQPSSITDPNGLVISRDYDGFGRLKQETRPDGTDTEWSRLMCTGGSNGNGYCGTNSSNVRWQVTADVRDTADNTIRSSSVSYDGFDRPRVETSQLLTGASTYTVKAYDAYGRLALQYVPFTVAGQGTQAWTYDLMGRVTQETLKTGADVVDRQTFFEYAGRTQLVTDAEGNLTRRYTDVRGRLRRLLDAAGGTTRYSYDAFGNLLSATDPGNAQNPAGNVTSWQYNLNGFVTASTDPARNTRTYSVNSLGELVSQTDAMSQTTNWTYDALGRPLTRSEPGQTTTWTWGTSSAAKNIGSLQSVANGTYIEALAYDSLARLSGKTITAGGTTYALDYGYSSATGLLESITYPESTSGYRFKTRYEYGHGVLTKISDFNASSTVFWQANAADARGQLLDETLGNGAQVISGYSPLTGLIDYRSVTAGGQVRQDLEFAWDKVGNLVSRTDLRQSNLTESFTYDALNRLQETWRGYGVANTKTDQINYDAIGNLTFKWSKAATYSYNAGRPYAVRDYTEDCGCNCTSWWQYTYNANGNMTSSAYNGTTERTITWTPADQPASITQGTSSSYFSYTPDRQLWKQTASYGGTTEETVYIGGLLEKMTRGGVTEYRHYIPAGTSSVAIYTRRTGGTPASTYYVTTDHLGSSTTVTDSSGATLVNLSFAPFGLRRGSAWQDTPLPADFQQIGNTTRHGFTGHEHLDSLGLIHMRGRVYDPYLQRFISADPIVDGLDTSQGLNRYGYVQNNPLSRWDPTGYEGEGIPEITVERWRYLGAAGVGGGGGGRNSIADPSDIDKAARRAEATHRKAKAKAERQAKEKKEIRARQCHAAISNAFAGGVSAATFFSLGGSPQFAPEAFLGGFIVGGVGGFFSEVGGGGFNAAIVTTFASVVTRVPNGSRMSEFVGALGDGANAATPLGALTIPTGSVVGVATKFFEASRGVSSFGLGAVGTTAVGLNAGAFAATVGIATSSLLDVSGIPEWLCN